MTVVRECSQQRSNLKDNGYIAIFIVKSHGNDRFEDENSFYWYSEKNLYIANQYGIGAF
ncbi:hypothetical protein [Photorhabdus sp. RW14-46]|uniref:hypothetical protein n=1 Tax=Photorhabdus sp. RW14-46 TaxID=2100168 RepID=UPI0030DC92CB